MAEKLKFYDKLGREIRPGDIILYTVNLGGSRSPGLLWALALEVLDNTGGTWLSSPTKLRVIGVEESLDGKPTELKSKPGELQFFRRTVLVDDERLIPEKVKRLLHSYRE